MAEEDEDLTEPIDSEMELTNEAPKSVSEAPKSIDNNVKWTEEEVITLFEFIKKYNLLNGNPTDLQLGETLAHPMNKLGFKRTPHQIRMKIRGLRRNYLKCIKSGYTEETLKNCHFFDLLDTVYSSKNLIIQYSFCKEVGSDEENDDIEDIWEKQELETMLSLIAATKLKSEITLSSFSLNSLTQISEYLGRNGFRRTTSEVKAALQNLKTTFIKFKRNSKRSQSTKDCPYYQYLKRIWGEEYAKAPEEPKVSNRLKDTEIWSEEETVMLLTSIKKMNIIDEAFQNTDYAAEKLLTILNDCGYERTKQQIQSKMENLMQSYIKGKRLDNEKEVLRKFPFFLIYDKIFGSCFYNFDFKTFGQVDSDQVESDQQTKRAIRSSTWTDKETKTLLDLIVELNLAQAFRERLSLKDLAKLEKPMKDRKYPKTALQIKVKMVGLQMHYLRCIKAGSTPEALAQCPFYNELNLIYKKSKTLYAPPLEIMKQPTEDSLAEVPEHLEAAEHIYLQSNRIIVTKDKKRLSKDKEKTWKPIETIIELNGIKKDHQAEEGERGEEGEVDDVHEVQEFEKVEEQVEQEFKEVKDEGKESEDEVIGVILEDNYADYVENYDDFEDLSNLDPLEFDPNFEDVSDYHSSCDEVSDNSVKILEDANNDLVTDPLEEIIPKENVMPKSSVETFANSETNALEKSPVKINENSQTQAHEKSPIKVLEKSSMKVLEKTPIKAPEKLPLTSKPVQIVPQLPERKRKLSDNELDALMDIDESSEVDSMSTLMLKVMGHERKLQKQHQEWLEHQFKIQRDHEREQRSVLLNELKEFRQAITLVMNKEVKRKKKR